MTPIEHYIEPARQTRAIWRVVLGLVAVFAAWVIWTLLCTAAMAYGVLEPIGLPASRLDTVFGGQQSLRPIEMGLILLTFIGLWVGLFFAVSIVHWRPFGTLFSPERRIRWRDFFEGAAIAFGVTLLSVAIWASLGVFPERSDMAVSSLALWFVPLAIAVFIQASGEELLFRGYILQVLGAWSRSPIVWGLIPSIVFGLIHLDLPLIFDGDPATSPDGASWIIALHAGTIGVIAAAMVWKTGALAAAMGLHVANNLVALNLFGSNGQLSGTQLFLFDKAVFKEMLVYDLGTTLLVLVFVIFFWRGGVRRGLETQQFS